eukprot:TRINITY_DN899_c0_g1_i2.p1 TRINITY_DN899_c0_g1~~TRINITY_DN899_c0_g1_i2.p1  ORF type:complete len:367 (+),score=130.40 TRINITY_DN899_c0_g1_i2:43-1143(+)
MADKAKNVEKKGTLLQLLWGAGGIYACFLYYGSLQEDVFRYKSETGEKFKYIWFLQVLESLANVGFSFAYLAAMGFTRNIPHDMFAMTGFTQVSAKYCTNAALASGVSFPVATLAKSGKMVPVMIGSLLLGGATYSLREYIQVFAIVAGTAIVSLGGGKKKSGGESTLWGVAFLAVSLICDGLTGGVQKRLKAKTAEKGVKLGPYDFMFWTNVYMLATALVFSIVNWEVAGIAFCLRFPDVMWLIIKFSICSALGQSFIFYTIATFDPLVCTTVTTTRKIFSVLYSIVFKGNPLAPSGWFGVMVASGGILAEIMDKSSGQKEIPKDDKDGKGMQLNPDGTTSMTFGTCEWGGRWGRMGSCRVCTNN